MQVPITVAERGIKRCGNIYISKREREKKIKDLVKLRLEYMHIFVCVWSMVEVKRRRKRNSMCCHTHVLKKYTPAPSYPLLSHLEYFFS